MLTSVAFINKMKFLQSVKAVKVFILDDDTNGDKKGK